METTTSNQLDGASRWASRLGQRLDEHLRQEGDILDGYLRFASEDLPELPAYLIRLVVEDEKRHHEVLAEIEQRLYGLLDAPEMNTELPGGAGEAVPPGLAEQTDRFLAVERADERELRHLLKALRVRRDQSLWSLAVGPDALTGSEEEMETWQHAIRPLSPKLIAEARLWELMVRLQLLDTRKHQMILEFIRQWCRTTEEASPTPAGD